MSKKNILKKRELVHVTSDGVERRFTAFEFMSAMELAPEFVNVNVVTPVIAGMSLDFPDAPVEAELFEGINPAFTSKGRDSLMRILEVLFNEKNCNKPLTLEEIKTGGHFNTDDLILLLEIAKQCAGLSEKKALPEMIPAITE